MVTLVSADARSTDGSKRVAAAKQTMTASASPVRGNNESRRNSGANTSRTNATFAPDTARRCDRPDARYSSRISIRERARVSEQEAGEQRPGIRVERLRPLEHERPRAVRDGREAAARRRKARTSVSVRIATA